MKKGFTLAEVLITLAIIGVVAALTIPVVVHKYQEKAYYTKFMKTYNAVAQAIQEAEAENGASKTWGTYYENTAAENNEIYEKNFIPFLRVQKVGVSANDLGITNDLKIKFLQTDGELAYSEAFYFDNEYYINPLLLSDGSLVQVVLSGNAAYFGGVIIDTNGIKGPNTVGLDIFFIAASDKNGASALGDYSKWELTSGDINANCSSNDSYIDDDTCAAKLIIEGKMDYSNLSDHSGEHASS